MSKDTRRRTLHYKLAKTTNTPYSLQELLEQSLDNKQSNFLSAKSRQEKLTDDGKAFRFINSHARHSGKLLLCQLVQFEEGLTQMTIEMDDQSESFELSPFTPADIKSSENTSANSKKKTEFLDSMLYFGVLENHVIILGSQSLRSKELEGHLNWFLMNLTKQLQTMLVLSDKPTNKALKQIEKQEAKSVVLGSDLEYETNIPEETDRPDIKINETNKVRWTPKSIGAEILDFLKGAGHLEQLNFDDSFDATNFHLTLELSYNRSTTKKGQKALDTVATSLRHLDKEDVKIHLKGGGVLHGNDLKLSTSINIQFINGKIDESDLYLTIINWLNSKINTEDITPDLNDVLLGS
jgi:hypothetical protein